MFSMKFFKIKGYIILYAIRTNNLFLTLFVKIKVLVPKNYVVVIFLIIQMYTALFSLNKYERVGEIYCYGVFICLI